MTRRLLLVLVGLLFVAGCGGGGGGSSGASTPSLIVVTNFNDDGPGSLRQAIADADGGDVIVFDSALPKGTVALLSHIVIDKPVVIGGLTGAFGRHRISGGNSTRPFTILAGASLELRDLEIFDCQGTSGGAINAGPADVVLRRVQFFSSAASFINTGGGAVFLAGGSLTAVDCAFTLCSGHSGGAIYAADSTVWIDRSAFYLNTALTSRGGAIYAEDCDLTLVNSTLDSNQAPDNVDGFGGAISATSQTTGSDVGIWSCTISDNGAGIGAGGLHVINVAATPDSVILRQSIVASNSAPVGPDIIIGVDIDGFPSGNVIGVADLNGVLAGGAFSTIGSVAVPVDPLLLAPAFHEGGRVMREPHMLSPAVDAMPAQLILDPLGAQLTVDQRDEPRPLGTAPVGAIAP